MVVAQSNEGDLMVPTHGQWQAAKGNRELEAVVAATMLNAGNLPLALAHAAAACRYDDEMCQLEAQLVGCEE